MAVIVNPLHWFGGGVEASFVTTVLGPRPTDGQKRYSWNDLCIYLLYVDPNVCCEQETKPFRFPTSVSWPVPEIRDGAEDPARMLLEHPTLHSSLGVMCGVCSRGPTPREGP